MTTNNKRLKNIAIIAHVDHGKTTLVDKLLKQSGTLNRKTSQIERIMDSNDQEKERGITILSKNTAIKWNDYHINIIDTPGHADFGGEVERALTMADSVLLLVDAVDGPMPQTRFVTQKAFEKNLKPIVVINKVDRPGARVDWVHEAVFDLFDKLGATEEQLDFSVVYCSALLGKAGMEIDQLQDDLNPLFELIVNKVPDPDVNKNGAFQMQICDLDYSSYLGVIGIGRIQRGVIQPNKTITVIDYNNNKRQAKILHIMGYHGLERVNVEHAEAGDIICITGIDDLHISDTICDIEHPEIMPQISVDEPTVQITMQVNDSPFAGKEGKLLTSRQIKSRLDKEKLHNVALRVEQGKSPDNFILSGRGELHLSVLIETMRREGFEMSISRPEVIIKQENGVFQEPYVNLTIDLDAEYQGTIIEFLGQRNGDLKDLQNDATGRSRLNYIIPAQSLIGFRTQFMTMTAGTGIMNHYFERYDKRIVKNIPKRNQGVLISMSQGKALGYALFNIQERGKLFLKPNVEVYEGMVIGINQKPQDLIVNPCKGKKLDNMRASGTDDNILLTPPIELSLEQAIEFIADDELVEVTPKTIRVRKKFLSENQRKQQSKKAPA